MVFLGFGHILCYPLLYHFCYPFLLPLSLLVLRHSFKEILADFAICGLCLSVLRFLLDFILLDLFAQNLTDFFYE